MYVRIVMKKEEVMNKKGCTDLEPLIWIVSIILAIMILITIPCWVSSKREAKILNETCNTNYSTADIFWAGETIKDIILGNKHRVEINHE